MSPASGDAETREPGDSPATRSQVPPADPAPVGAGGAPEAALATWASSLQASDLPGHVIDRVKLLLLDAIASACAGRLTADRDAMASAATTFAGPGDATVIGGGTLSLAGATLLNGYQVTAATVCDVHRPTLCHVTPVVVPPVLAIAEARDADGPTVLAALAAGFETVVRVGLSTDYPVFRTRGWHSPGVVGPFGAAMAVSRLLGLDATAARHALGHAGSQAAGTFAGLGTAQVKLHQARGGMSGLLAALMAANGLDASPHILTAADGGLYASYAGGGRPDQITDGLGERWDLLSISLRRWPAASSIQAVVQATLALASDWPGTTADVRGVRVGLPEASFRLNGGATWHDQLSAFQSARYVAAVVLHDRQCWLEQFSPERISDPALGEFARARVRVEIDASLPPGAAVVALETVDGGGSTNRVDVPLGDPSSPLAVDDVAAKLRQATSGGPLESRVDSIVRSVVDLEAASSLRPLMATLRG